MKHFAGVVYIGYMLITSCVFAAGPTTKPVPAPTSQPVSVFSIGEPTRARWYLWNGNVQLTLHKRYVIKPWDRGNAYEISLADKREGYVSFLIYRLHDENEKLDERTLKELEIQKQDGDDVREEMVGTLSAEVRTRKQGSRDYMMVDISPRSMSNQFAMEELQDKFYFIGDGDEVEVRVVLEALKSFNCFGPFTRAVKHLRD